MVKIYLTIINFESIKLSKNLIIHYHAWVNERLKYNDNMKATNYLTILNRQ